MPTRHYLSMFLTATSAILFVCGCGRNRAEPAPAPAPITERHIELDTTFNTSESARPQLPGWVEGYVEIDRQLDPTLVSPHFFRLDNRLREFSNSLADDGDTTIEKLCGELANLSGMDNTYTELYWAEMVSRVGASKDPIVLLWFHDGFSEGSTPASHRAIHECAGRLATMPQLAGVAIVGVRPESAAELNADIAPLKERLGARFILRFASDDFVHDVNKLIEGAHNR